MNIPSPSLRQGHALLFLLCAGAVPAFASELPAPLPTSYQVRYVAGVAHTYRYTTRADVQMDLQNDVRVLPTSGLMPLIPAMTGESLPTGRVTASGIYGAGYEPWKALDGKTGTLWLSNMNTTSVWLDYEFPGADAFVATSYKLTYANGSCCEGRAPKDWTLQGWDGFKWVTVDTVRGETGWYANPVRTFQVANPGPYHRYRLTVTADNYNRTSPIHLVSIAEFQLFGAQASEAAPVQQTSRNSGMDLSADVVITPLKAMADGSTLIRLDTRSASFATRDAKGISQPVETEADDLVDLRRPIYFTQKATGEIVDLWRHPDESTSTTNLKRGIISAFQFRQPGLKAATTESDVTGVLRPQYTAGTLKSGGAQTLMKTWRGEDMVEPAGGATALNPLDVSLAGRQQIEINTVSGLVTRVEADASAISVKTAESAYGGHGVGASSEVRNTGTLEYVSTAPAKPLVPILDSYIKTTLVAEPVLEKPDPIDLPLEKELPTSDLAYVAWKTAARLDAEPDALALVSEQLQDQETSPTVKAVLVDALGLSGGSRAQQVLVHELLTNALVAPELRQRALSAISTLKSPSESTALALEWLSESGDADVALPVLTALGAVTHTLQQTRPVLAARLVIQMEHRLKQAKSDAEASALICALGNAGFETSLESLRPFARHQNAQLRKESLEAFRKLRDLKSEAVLREVLDQDSDASVREMAAQVLDSREELPAMELVRSTVLLNKAWTRTIGGNAIRAVLSGQLKVTESPFHIEGRAEAVGHAWSFSKSLVKGEATGDVTVSGTTRQLAFNASFYLAGNKIGSFNKTINCGYVESKTWSGSTTFLSATYRIPIWGPLTANLGVGLSGSASLVASADLNGCTTQPYAQASITPGGAVSGYAEAYVSVWIAKGGATLRADLLKAGLPATFKGTLSTSGFKAYGKADLTMQAMTGKLDLWVKVRKPWGGWKSWSWNVWSFGNAPYTYNFFTVQIP